MNTRDKGTQSETYVISELLRCGYPVSQPLTEERYDLVVDTRDGFVAAQVKRMREARSGAIKFGCKSNYNGVTEGESYTADEIDGFIAHHPETDQLYWVPVDDAPSTKMQIRVSEPENNSPNINWHKDYVFENTFEKVYSPPK